tara:strand:+ start:1114 stop:1950 length:837 start_codon:yes stop_codon:yes gene_type:complete
MTTTTDLNGSVAFITGAGRGIGRGIAEVLSRRGAKIAVSDIGQKDLLDLETYVQSIGGDMITGSVDVTDKSSISTFVNETIEKYGKIDICVPNAGVIGAQGFNKRVDSVDEDWDVTWEVNVRGVSNTVEEVKGHMISRKSGKIVIIASHGGRKPRGVAEKGRGTVQQPYMVSKAAVIQFMHLLSIELGQHNINVNAVCPGRLWTPMWEAIAINHKTNNSDYRDMSTEEIFIQLSKATMSLGRPQTPEDIGKSVAFLASDDSSEITGQAINVNGGATLN